MISDDPARVDPPEDRPIDERTQEERAEQLYRAFLEDNSLLWEGLGPDGIPGLYGPPHLHEDWYRRHRAEQEKNEAQKCDRIRTAMLNQDWAALGLTLGNQLESYLRNKAQRAVEDGEYEDFARKYNLPIIE